jgi:hypothetical protein
MIRGCALVTIAVVLSIPTAASECPGLLSSLVIERVPDGGEPAEPARILDVAADGTLGAAVHPDGVVVFDLTDPTDPAIHRDLSRGRMVSPDLGSTTVHRAVRTHRPGLRLAPGRGRDLRPHGSQAIEVVARVPADGVHDVAVVGSIAYVAAGSLHVLDITDPSQPVELGSYATRSWAPSVAVDHPWAYVTEWTEGLFGRSPRHRCVGSSEPDGRGRSPRRGPVVLRIGGRERWLGLCGRRSGRGHWIPQPGRRPRSPGARGARGR